MGHSVAYLDWSSQEVAIAAALSGDDAMWKGCATCDPSIAFPIQVVMAPEGATATTHTDIRNRCKAIVPGVQYGMSAQSMALNAGLH